MKTWWREGYEVAVYMDRVPMHMLGGYYLWSEADTDCIIEAVWAMEQGLS